MTSQFTNNSTNPAQAQMSRDESNTQNQQQSSNFLQEEFFEIMKTGTQVANMAQGAADVGKGAVQGAVSLAKGAALGAANMAEGAANAVKNTLGANSNAPNTNTNSAAPGNPGTTTNTTSGNPTAAAGLGGGSYPSSTHPSNPSH